MRSSFTVTVVCFGVVVWAVLWLGELLVSMTQAEAWSVKAADHGVQGFLIQLFSRVVGSVVEEFRQPMYLGYSWKEPDNTYGIEESVLVTTILWSSMTSFLLLFSYMTYCTIKAKDYTAIKTSNDKELANRLKNGNIKWGKKREQQDVTVSCTVDDHGETFYDAVCCQVSPKLSVYLSNEDGEVDNYSIVVGGEMSGSTSAEIKVNVKTSMILTAKDLSDLEEDILKALNTSEDSGNILEVVYNNAIKYIRQLENNYYSREK